MDDIFTLCEIPSCCETPTFSLLSRQETFRLRNDALRTLVLTIAVNCKACGHQQTRTKQFQGSKDYLFKIRARLQAATDEARRQHGVPS